MVRETQVLRGSELYFRELKKIPVLSQQEEQELGRQIEGCHQIFLSSLCGYEERNKEGEKRKGLEILAKEIEKGIRKSGWNGEVSKEEYREFRELERNLGASREPKEGEGRWAYLSQVDELYNNLFEMFCYRLPRSFLRAAAKQLYKHWEEGAQEGERAGQELRREREELGKSLEEEARATERFVCQNLRLVVKYAFELSRRLGSVVEGGGIEVSDLIQHGNIGLIKAADCFDYRRGRKFSTYAIWWIRQNMGRAAADYARTIKIPVYQLDNARKCNEGYFILRNRLGREPRAGEVAEEVGLTSGEVERASQLPRKRTSFWLPEIEESPKKIRAMAQEGEKSEEKCADEELSRRLSRLFYDCLTGREEKVIRLFFGIGNEEEYGLNEIGEGMELTRERIRQVKEKALEKLKSPKRLRRKSKKYLNEEDI